jgi:hypothetical protein
MEIIFKIAGRTVTINQPSAETVSDVLLMVKDGLIACSYHPESVDNGIVDLALDIENSNNR